jgi:uncharacterized protein (TIGR00251 family)
MSRDRAATAALDLVEMAGRTRLRLRVKPGAKKNALLGAHGGALKLGVVTHPERGKANRSALKLLARELGVPVAEIDLVSGASSQNKTVLVPLSPAVLAERLQRALS